MKESKNIMNNRKPLIDHDGEVRELSAEDFKHFRPASEVLPPALYAELVAIKATRGAQKSPLKQVTSMRLDQDILAAFKATGRGWQTRLNDLLRKHLDEVHS